MKKRPLRVRKKLTKRKSGSRAIENIPIKHQLFVGYYVLHWNASLAAREAGLSAGGAAQCRRMGHWAMQDPGIRAAIKEETSIQSARLNITKEKVTHMLLETYTRAKARGRTAIELQAALGLAKLHGLMLDRKQIIYAELSTMDEEEIRNFLGTSYDPKLLDKVVESIPPDSREALNLPSPGAAPEEGE